MLKSFKISGLTDAATAKRIEYFVHRLEGIESITIHPMTETLCVHFDEKQTNSAAIESILRKAGYEILTADVLDTLPPAEQHRLQRQQLAISFLCLLPLLALSVGSTLHSWGFLSAWPALLNPAEYPLNLSFLQLGLLLPILFVHYKILLHGLNSLARFRPQADSLLSIGVLSAIGCSLLSTAMPSLPDAAYPPGPCWGIAGLLPTFFTLGSYIETKFLQKNVRYIRLLPGSLIHPVHFTDAFCGRIALFGTILAICSTIFWSLAGASSVFTGWIFLLVLLCCSSGAIAFVTPISLLLAARKARSLGAILRDGDTWELSSHISAVVFDLTGTLTTGKPEITDILPEGLGQDTLLALAAAAESSTEHPLGRAICQEAERRRLRIQRVAAFNEIPTAGVETLWNGQALRVGKSDWQQEQGVKISAELLTKADQLASKGKTPLFVSTGTTCKGLIALHDPLRQESYAAVQQLTALDIQVILLSGCEKATVRAQAHALGIQTFRGGISPKDKAKEIQLLQAHGNIVAMVGSSLRDAPAIARSDLSLSLASGSKQLGDGAAITLLHHDLRDLSQLVVLSRAAMHNIKLNLLWAFLYNLILLPAALGLLYPLGNFLPTPQLVTVAILTSCLSVLLNSFRLHSFQFPAPPFLTK